MQECGCRVNAGVGWLQGAWGDYTHDIDRVESFNENYVSIYVMRLIPYYCLPQLTHFTFVTMIKIEMLYMWRRTQLPRL